MKKIKLMIIAPYCASDKGGDSLGVFRWIQMLRDKMEIWYFSTEQTNNPDIAHRFFYQNCADSPLSKIKKAWTYYKTDYSKPNFLEKPDIIQIHNPHFWALGCHFPGVPKILWEHDVNWNFLKHDMTHGPTLKKIPFKKLWRPWLLWRATQYEKKALKQAAHIFAISETDKKEFTKKLPALENKVTVIPNSLDPSHYPATDALGDTVLFMGPLSYSANRDAVEIICQELAPRLPQFPFKILGGGTYEKPHPKNVEFLGFLPDILPILSQARVFIVPIRYGSGTRFKIVEALAMQRAVVSTPKGAEGLEITHRTNIWIEKDWEPFAKAIERLWNHPEEGQRLGKAGRQFVEERHNLKKHADLVFQIYQNALQGEA
ncbi:MAG: hypothetical protein A2W61_08320 [Deltaproteobacteria bacterium RIFCSPLOWO2_01_44_7]|nr:MAG: hypothetical protein A2712_02280 [Deltaproteobacteria bacterium RIFCSPHIGHO2_01_FULL_43_49]OGQ15048.1 MAG: hypothetical protein A3D22_03200 [Deltaproteobacteria bacterium RIFCSPHIGHO2_02_FULL_44_53]OGQ27333.1 MAG: hypothetical protein A3D98_02875 [Deltaproteobacteria bacterium RIFCSPHIGHO2_12_FULL_44_21]OGQ31565.1 MAG: hypothetical protein A2979_04360 [Deltaproteobacteria bacterium RIFCSPLOWO2_01_FULL_45_74]OGQ42624.1 MAG: hypothetical protein A2W61_08320 [Deltaproteobacteria bacterium 